MRIHIAVLLSSLAPAALTAQAPGGPGDLTNIEVETTTVVLDQERVRGLGIDGVRISSGNVDAGAYGHSPATIRIGTRVGDLDVSTWLTLVRRNRAVRQESTHRILTLSGSAARLASTRTEIGSYGQSATAGPELWVEPVALEDGKVRLRVWTAVGDVRAGRYGTLSHDVPIEASTEIVVASGTPVMIASMQRSEDRSRSGVLSRAGSSAESEAWIVVTARIVGHP